jgi:hypothetical protein
MKIISSSQEQVIFHLKDLNIKSGENDDFDLIRLNSLCHSLSAQESNTGFHDDMELIKSLY